MAKTKIPPHGEKTIKVTIALWTDGIAKDKGKVVKGHAWDTGSVYMVRNPSHGIVKKNFAPIPFGDSKGLAEIPSVIKKLLKKHQVVLHRDRG